MKAKTQDSINGGSARARLVSALPVRDVRRQVAGLESAVLEGGEGPPIVLLHGPGGYAAHWMRIIPALVQKFHVIAPDLPGHGSSELGSAPLDAARAMAWLDDLIAQTCAAPPILLGELTSGALAARFSAAHPGRASRLVLVDSFGLRPFEPAPEFARALGAFGAAPSAQTHQTLWSFCAHDVVTLQRQLDSLWEPFQTYNIERARSESSPAAVHALMTEFGIPAISPEVLGQIDVPTSLIWGRHDLATPVSVAGAVSLEYGWPLHVIEDANDAPAMERPEAFLRALFQELENPACHRPSNDASRAIQSSGREQVGTLVIGGGQAGLATSYWLSRSNIEHVVVERRTELGGAWHDRWDSFHLVAPNFCLLLPGMPYAGPEPDAFMQRDAVIEYVRNYAKFCAAPLRLGCHVESLTHDRGEFVARTSTTTFVANDVILATGPYQQPKVPALAREISPHIMQVHAHDYRRPSQLPTGGVLVVGTGQSGTQIAEELLRAGRDVHLAVSMCPSVPRRYRGRDIIWWLLQSFQNRERLRLPFPMVDDLPTPAARFGCNPHLSGADGGHDIHLRRFARLGMKLYGHLESASGPVLTFTDDLAERLTYADSMFDEEFRPLFDAYIEAAGIDAMADDRDARDTYVPPIVTRLDLDDSGIRSVIWATGYTLDFSWVKLPIFDEWGYPRHRRGVTEHPGLYAVGLPWLHSEPSSVFAGVGEDAAFVVAHLAKHRARRA